MECPLADDKCWAMAARCKISAYALLSRDVWAYCYLLDRMSRCVYWHFQTAKLRMYRTRHVIAWAIDGSHWKKFVPLIWGPVATEEHRRREGICRGVMSGISCSVCIRITGNFIARGTSSQSGSGCAHCSVSTGFVTACSHCEMKCPMNRRLHMRLSRMQWEVQQWNVSTGGQQH